MKKSLNKSIKVYLTNLENKIELKSEEKMITLFHCFFSPFILFCSHFSYSFMRTTLMLFIQPTGTLFFFSFYLFFFIFSFSFFVFFSFLFSFFLISSVVVVSQQRKNIEKGLKKNLFRLPVESNRFFFSLEILIICYIVQSVYMRTIHLLLKRKK